MALQVSDIESIGCFTIQRREVFSLQASLIERNRTLIERVYVGLLLLYRGPYLRIVPLPPEALLHTHSNIQTWLKNTQKNVTKNIQKKHTKKSCTTHKKRGRPEKKMLHNTKKLIYKHCLPAVFALLEIQIPIEKNYIHTYLLSCTEVVETSEKR